MSDAQPPAGWYPDPKDPWSERRWDGTAWTENVRTKTADEGVFIEEPTVAFEQRQDDFWDKKDQPAAAAPGSSNRRNALVVALGLLGVAAIAGYLFLQGDSDVTTDATSAVLTSAVPTSALPSTPTAGPIITSPSTVVPTSAPPTTTSPTSSVPTTAAPTTAVPTTVELPSALIELPLAEPPVGAIDDANYSPTTRTVRLRGWAMDADTRAPVNVTLFIDLAESQSRLADDRRADLAPIYRNGVRHGFTFEFELPPGPHGYCVIAENVGGGDEDTTIFCETRNV